MTDKFSGQSEHTHGSGSHSRHLNQPALDSDEDLAEESKPCLYSFSRIKLLFIHSVVTADIASSVESEDPAEDPVQMMTQIQQGECLITGNSPLQLSLISYTILTVE